MRKLLGEWKQASYFKLIGAKELLTASRVKRKAKSETEDTELKIQASQLEIAKQ
jgi:hypothetical protein